MVQALITVQKGTLLRNIQIPNTRYGTGSALAGDRQYHPHLIDFYIPRGTINRAVVGLHGGSGNKDQYSKNNSIIFTSPPTASTVNWTILSLFKFIFVAVQGFACTGVDLLWGAGNNPFNPTDVDTRNALYPNGLTSWDNGGFMLSGVDDVQMLKDLSTYISNTYGGSVGKALIGHSAGAFMVQRMWFLGGGSYTRFAAVSGPQSGQVGALTMPAVKFPIYEQYGHNDDHLGLNDGVAGTGYHFFENTWTQNPQWVNKADVDYPNPSVHTGGWKGLLNRCAASSLPVPAQSDGVTDTVAIGTTTTWNYNANKYRTVVLSAAGHELTDQSKALGQNTLVKQLLWMASV